MTLLIRITLLLLVILCSSADADVHGNWTTTRGSGLEDCDYCRTMAFHEKRKRLARQGRKISNSAGSGGYIVALRDGKRRRIGRASLMGLGDLITTDSHVIYRENGDLRVYDGVNLYFEPMLDPAILIEIEISSLEVGKRGNVSGVSQKRYDWANAYLKKDVFDASSNGELFALLWNRRIDFDAFNSDPYRKAANFVFGPNNRLSVDKSCFKVEDQRPDQYGFHSPDIFFLDCPKHVTREGSSGSAVTIVTNESDGFQIKHLVGQIVSRESEIRANGAKGDGRMHWTPIVVLGLTPERLESLNRMYITRLKENGQF